MPPTGAVAVIRPDNTFDTGPIAIGATGTWVMVARIQNRGRRVTMQGLVGPNALTHLKLSQAWAPDGSHNDILVDTDFASATAVLQSCYPAAPNTTAANGSFQMTLDTGAYEIGVWAQASTATTLELLGFAFRLGD